MIKSLSWWLLWRGDSNGRHNRPYRQSIDEIYDFQIARTEILPPLGNAVRILSTF